MPPRLQNLLLPALAICTFATPSVADHAVSREETHGDWVSLAVDTGDGYFARAITFQFDENGEISTFNIDSPANDCDSVVFTINVNLSEIQEESFASPTLFGRFRVDRNPVHDLTYTLTIERGKNFISLYIRDWSRSDSVLEEIMSGRTARFKFELGDDSYYYRFSLKGSREAILRQDQLCRELGGDDEHYFRQEEEDDQIYFEA